MPRRPRIYLPDIPAHVIQRGNNGSPCFFQPRDYKKYREFLAEGLRRYGVRLHAYVLMTNHVHLLMTPSDTAGISRVMQHIGRCYVGYVNWCYGRTGTLWEGRHRASLVQTDVYLLNVYRYIELNPVRAGMVTRPGKYAWSSFLANTGVCGDELITPHEGLMALGSDRHEAMNAYLKLFDTNLTGEALEEIRVALKFNFPLGNDRFRAEIEKTSGRKLGRMCGGRPKKSESDQ